jgi:VanZ family protein
MKSTVPVLLAIYVAYLVLFALAPFTPAVDASVPVTELYKKFEGLSGFTRLTPWDIVTNVLLFVPYGVLVVMLPVMSSQRWWTKLLLVLISASLLSTAVELGQLLLPRKPSVSDVSCIVVGGVTGALLGILAHGPILRVARQLGRGVHDHAALAGILIAYILGLYAVFSMPLPLSKDFSNWDPAFHLLLGNEGSLDRPWRGELYLVALYSRALTGQEVWTNFTAGPYIHSVQKRVDNGLILFYDFSETAGDIVHDRAASGPYAHLRVQDPAGVQWLTPNGLSLRDRTVIASSAAPIKLSAARFSPVSELSVEGWISPAGLWQDGPARIISYSRDANQRNFTLGQDRREVVFRLRTPTSGLNGMNPELHTTDQPLRPGIQHLVVTYRQGIETLYVNGAEETRAMLLVKVAFIDAVVDLVGKQFKWPLWSLFVFPLGILSYLFSSRWRWSPARIRWISLVAAVATLGFILGLRVVILKTSVEPMQLPIGAGTLLISILSAPRFTNIV